MVTGAYVLGTTGEGIHCSVEERKKVAERWVNASQGKLDLIIHTGALSIADTLELARHAETLDIKQHPLVVLVSSNQVMLMILLNIVVWPQLAHLLKVLLLSLHHVRFKY